MGVIKEAFQMMKELSGIRQTFPTGCKNVPDKEGIHKRRKGWIDELFNKKTEMMREENE